MLPRLGLTTRLFLAVLSTAVLVVVLMGGATRWHFERGFLGYLNELAVERMAYIQPRLTQAYVERGSWDFLRDEPRRWFGLMRPMPGQELPVDARQHPPVMLLSDLTGAVQRMGLLDAQDQWVAGYREITPAMRKTAITHNGQTVGWLVLAPFQAVADGAEQRFEQGLSRALMVVGVLALLLAVAVAWWLSQALLAPVRRVAGATHRLAAGDHSVRVEVPNGARDEVSQLSEDFNHLALTLERNEALRREFMADVSHELRTPLAVLRGELEALEDGIRPLDQGAVRSLQGEVAQLGQLVEDLYELALSDAGALSYRMAPVDLHALVERVGHSHAPRLAQAGLSLVLPAPGAESAWVPADENRLQQLLDNLLENSRRYTDAPGEVRLGLALDGGHWVLRLEDSAPGVPPEAQALLFERFFRVDRSRSRASGGAGLGLAICRNIVLAHGGQIQASASALGGVCIEVRLPRLKVQP